ncbi:MAG: metallophosphoesterase family protein [FCB group bacterium]|jgi:hypothetical protein|nr:metallophosphoesterase family protein [FCB group bacterium]
MLKRSFRLSIAVLLLIAAAQAWAQESAVKSAMDSIRGRLATSLTRDQLVNLDAATVDKTVTPEERRILATEYWSFDANVPVIVSVMRPAQQKTVPWWLTEAGFTSTGQTVRNENYEYDVWQKNFDAGHIGLGINGFDGHRPPYFVCVGPREKGADLKLSNFFPANQKVWPMRKGATTYHDWTELVITELPESIDGHLLLPTIRGRSREAHLMGAFRETAEPSSGKPDQVVLTWSDDPKTTMTVQWRANASVEDGLVRYREKGAEAWTEAAADRVVLQDLLILNDPRVSRFTAVVRGLKPATAYEYTVGTAVDRTEPAQFTTGPADASPFTFLVLSDTHNKPETGELVEGALKAYPAAAFLTISGDLVGTGQHRNDYEQLFAELAPLARTRPVMPALGNHDTIDGLGNDVYLALFGLPTNGSPSIPAEQTYSFRYGNAQFIVLDSMSTEQTQAPWLEEQLKNSDAKWKFVVFHFPPYSFDEDVYQAMLDSWIPLFDRYNVDMVFTGHVHYYLRTLPMREHKPAPDGKGTVYMISVAVKGRNHEVPKPDYAAAVSTAGIPMYLAITVDAGGVVLRAQDATGKIHDEYTMEKP